MPAEQDLPQQMATATDEAAMLNQSDSTKWSHRREKRRFTRFWAHVGTDRDPASHVANVQLSVATLRRYAAAR
jgi:hypothetical protein